jgi:hypothetical protein
MSETLVRPLTDAELDVVSAGALINLFDVASHNNIQVAVPVNAAVAANVLGGGAAAGAVQTGRVS